MVSESMLHIGILADSSLQQHLIRRVVEEFGYRVAVSRLLPNVAKRRQDAVVTADPFRGDEGVDAWIVDLNLTGPLAMQLGSWLDMIHTPVIFGDGVAASPSSDRYIAWSRRLREKLQQLAGTINLERQMVQKARRIWVLAASTGGPKAINSFLCALPAEIGVGFLYVQHIDAEFDRTLAKVVVKGSHYKATVARHGDVIGNNSVVVVATGERIEIQKNSTLSLSHKPWPGPYQPSIDQVVANVARTFGCNSGVIIFTGMGNDGAASARLMHQQGAQVWAQTPESCTSPSMPEMASATGCVSYTGTPQELAAQLVGYLKQSSLKSPYIKPLGGEHTTGANREAEDLITDNHS